MDGERGTDIRFRDLGTLIFERDGISVPLGGARLAAALSMLLVNVDRRVSRDALAQAMYGLDAAPRSASTLESHIHRLRKLLEPDRGPRAPSEVLLHDVAGFRLLATSNQVDSLRFEQLTGETADLLSSGQPDRALRRADEALTLWRGRPFTAVADEPWAAAAVGRLEELHAQVRERRVDALLRVGDPQQALLGLAEAIGEHPLRERLWAQEMLANFRLGRTDEALQVFRRARKVFLHEVGVEPGAELRDLQARILAADPGLLHTPGMATANSRGHPGEVHLPGRLSRLIGRAAELERLTALVRDNQLVTLVGAAGCGKTRLALEVARASALSFPDGVWFVDLTAALNGEQALDGMISAVGVVSATAGSARQALHSYTRDRRMLLLLDNCEHILDSVAELVDDLLLDGSELTVLATSREPLDIDGEIVSLLNPLPLAAAVELFTDRWQTAEPLTEVTAEDYQTLTEICAAVDGVPLALELAAARARSYSLAEIAGQVRADPSALAQIGRARVDHHRTVRYAIEQSYRMLPADEATLHRAVSVVPGPFTAGLADALIGTADAGDLIPRLVHRSLLVPLGPREPGRPSRFNQLATVRGQAMYAATDPGELFDRRDRWVSELVAGRPRLGQPAEAGWMAAIDDDLIAVRGALEAWLDPQTAPRTTPLAGLVMYWYYRGMTIEGRRWLERAVSGPGFAALSPTDAAVTRLSLASALTLVNRVDLARPQITAGLALLSTTDDGDALVLGDSLATVVSPLGLAEDRPLIAVVTDRIAALAESTGDGNLAVLAEMGRYLPLMDGSAPPDEVAVRAAAVYEHAMEVQNFFAARIAAGSMAILSIPLGRFPEGMLWSDRQIAAHVALGISESPLVMEVRANLLSITGDAAGAIRLYAAARSHHQRAGMRWPTRTGTAALLDRATGMLDRDALEGAWREGASLTIADLTTMRATPDRGSI